MKGPLVAAVALAFTMLVETASADRLTKEQREEVVVTDEAGDEWLHGHCSFRGMNGPHEKDAKVTGLVVELIDDGQAPITKEFRCGDRPPFWKGAWTPAPPEAVDCAEPKPAGLCVPPPAAPAQPLAASVIVATVVTAPPPLLKVTVTVAVPKLPPPRTAQAKAKRGAPKQPPAVKRPRS